MIEVLIGGETDGDLLERLSANVRSLGGSIKNSDWAIGGSQEITTYKITLPQGNLEAVAETYIGLLLRGPEELVSLLAKSVMPN
jgi:hypothetical protein